MSRTSVLLSPRRPSEIQLSLADVTGPGGISLIEPSYDPNGTFDTNDASSIAPWSEPAEEPPTPPSKGSTSGGKFSIPGLGKSLRGRTGSTETRQPTLNVSETFTNMASASSLTLDSQYSQPRHRNHSNLSVSVTHPAGDGSSPVNLSPHPPSPDRSRTTLRQKVSKSLFKRSKSRLRDSPRNSEDSIIPPVPTNDYGTTTMMSNVSTMTLPLHGEPSVNGKKDSHSSGKSGKKSKSLFKSPSGMLSTDVVSSTLKEKSEPGVYYTLDQDLENMSDIVDTSKAPTDPALTLTSQAVHGQPTYRFDNRRESVLVITIVA
ncbi:hypothetical protein DL96DRAFT_555352 [Flagelloscypha sp. PMI_526]|nr:hypothetical protein DL96DRAFT_555352 [Flagelloscypha sp. PMI_526]